MYLVKDLKKHKTKSYIFKNMYLILVKIYDHIIHSVLKTKWQIINHHEFEPQKMTGLVKKPYYSRLCLYWVHF